MNSARRNTMKCVECWVIGLIFFVLFIMPVLFTRIEGQISWPHVLKIWLDLSLLIPLFFINRFVLMPWLMLRGRYIGYLISIVLLIGTFTSLYYLYETTLHQPRKPRHEQRRHPDPIPPYAHLLMYSILIVGVDTGLLFVSKWRENEAHRLLLEKENTRIQFDLLRNQVSPHFFMNTLNNIYSLVGTDTPVAREAIMRLSKLMRYMLYESSDGRVSLDKEMEFIRSYIELMRLRFPDDVQIRFSPPERVAGVSIPPMIFISYIENAFKYGVSYQHRSIVDIRFTIENNLLCFECSNTNFEFNTLRHLGGLGMKNSEKRLQLLFDSRYQLQVDSTHDMFTVLLNIPLET